MGSVHPPIVSEPQLLQTGWWARPALCLAVSNDQCDYCGCTNFTRLIPGVAGWKAQLQPLLVHWWAGPPLAMADRTVARMLVDWAIFFLPRDGHLLGRASPQCNASPHRWRVSELPPTSLGPARLSRARKMVSTRPSSPREICRSLPLAHVPKLINKSPSRYNSDTFQTGCFCVESQTSLHSPRVEISPLQPSGIKPCWFSKPGVWQLVFLVQIPRTRSAKYGALPPHPL